MCTQFEGSRAKAQQTLCLALGGRLESVPRRGMATDPGQATLPNHDLFVLTGSSGATLGMFLVSLLPHKGG